MMKWAAMFFALALVLAMVSFTGITGFNWPWGITLFWVVFLLALILFVAGLMTPKSAR